MNLSDATVHLNKHHHRFEMTLDGKLSFVEYKAIDGQTLILSHTEVHPDLEGQGVGSALVKAVLEYVEQNNLSIVPTCPFVAAYIKRHPEWQRVVLTVYPLDDF